LLKLPNANDVAFDGHAQPSHDFGLDFQELLQDPSSFVTVVVSLLFVVIFDTGGVQHGIGQQAGLLDESGNLPGAKYSYFASAIASGLGAILGTSPVIIHNESAAGVQEGGRTGLCAVTTAVLFLLSPMLVPLIVLIPPEATAPCLVLVGTMMMAPVRDIDFGDLRIALPAFLIISVTPLTYSISAGIFSGIASYFVLGAVLHISEVATRLGETLGMIFASKKRTSREELLIPLPDVPPSSWAEDAGINERMC
jgi:AGZA family xanthine/uracil permease-like MFS transporter